MPSPQTMAIVYQRAITGFAGVIALSIGVAIAFFPITFYASYGISIDTDPNVLSELRAPGTNLAVLGVIMIAGAFKTNWFNIARVLVISVFLAFAAGRLVSWGIDGIPNASILSALVIEAVIGILVLLTTRPHKGRS